MRNSTRLTIAYRDLSNKEFNNNDTKGPKSVSTFLTKLSELAPRLVIKQMTLLVKQLDSEVRQFIRSIENADTNFNRPTPFGVLLSKLAVILLRILASRKSETRTQNRRSMVSLTFWRSVS